MCRKKTIHITRIRKEFSDILGSSIVIDSDMNSSETKRIHDENCCFVF